MIEKALRNYRILIIAICVTAIVVIIKYIFHAMSLEIVQQTSLHNSMISSVIFVIGFVLSATIADYKESERIPSEFASTVENMYEDAKEIKQTYAFDLGLFRNNLIDVLSAFREGTRANREGARREIGELNKTFGEMEQAGVPANFIVKLKQQQAILLKNMYRVNYIQRIKFIPSAFFLVRAIVGLSILTLLFTNIDPFYGGLALTGTITFIMVYVLVLVQIVSVPFHKEGQTKDDVSLFLIRETKQYLQNEQVTK